MYSALKLIGILAGFTALFYLSGAASLRDIRRPKLSLGLAAGLLAGIICAMVTAQINLAFLLQGCLALVGLYRFCTPSPNPNLNPSTGTNSESARGPYQSMWKELSVFTILLFLFSLLLMSDPISAWDARSIWFYHAKVIYLTKDIWAHGHWAEQANIYTHLNYPKLFPLLAAHVASAFGFWNEYVPKLAIALLAAPIFAFFAELALAAQYDRRTRAVNGLLLFMLLFMFDGAGFYLNSGYMDGWVALYSVCAAMSLSTAIKHQASDDRYKTGVQAFVFLAILSQIKQEGLILSLILLAVTLALVLRPLPQRINAVTQILASSSTRRALFGVAWYSLFLVGPIIAWLIAAEKQGLSLGHYSGNTIARIAAKLAVPGQPLWIMANAILHNGMILPSLALALILTVIAVVSKKPLKAPDFLPLFAGLIYLCVIFMVYLSTNADVNWHMEKSAGRVGLTPGLLIATYNYRCIVRIFFTDNLITRQACATRA